MEAFQGTFQQAFPVAFPWREKAHPENRLADHHNLVVVLVQARTEAVLQSFLAASFPCFPASSADGNHLKEIEAGSTTVRLAAKSRKLTHWRHERWSSITHNGSSHRTMSTFVLSCDLVDNALRFVVSET